MFDFHYHRGHQAIISEIANLLPPYIKATDSIFTCGKQSNLHLTARSIYLSWSLSRTLTIYSSP